MNDTLNVTSENQLSFKLSSFQAHFGGVSLSLCTNGFSLSFSTPNSASIRKKRQTFRFLVSFLLLPSSLLKSCPRFDFIVVLFFPFVNPFCLKYLKMLACTNSGCSFHIFLCVCLCIAYIFLWLIYYISIISPSKQPLSHSLSRCVCSVIPQTTTDTLLACA